MSRSSLLIVVGILAILLPFLGLPSSWLLHFLIPLFGLTVAIVGFLIRSEHVRKSRAAREVAPPPVAPPDAISPIA